MKRSLIAPIVLLVVFSPACSDTAQPSTQATTTQVTGEVDLLGDVESFTDLTQNHVDTDVDYPQSPPVGGDHSGIWQNCGIYDGPIADVNAVHSLEHGAVWLAYRNDLPAAEIEELGALARGHTHVLVSPYPDLAEPVVATAWGTQLRLSTFDLAKLKAFVARYEQGPQTPELGVTCAGALGEPIG